MDRTIMESIEAVKRAYERLPKPVMLATLGLELKKEGTPILKLKQFIEEHMNDYTIVQHPEIAEKVAISTKAGERETLEQLQCSRRLVDNLELEFLEKLDRKFIFAFCAYPDQSAYITAQPIWRYNERPVGKTVYEITPGDKHDVYLPQKIYKLAPNAVSALATKIRAWLERQKLLAERFYKNTAPIEEYKGRAIYGYRKVLDPLLVRFIDAQPEVVRSQIVIPLSFIN